MNSQKLLDEWMDRLRDMLRDSPARDLEKNLRAGLTALFGRLDLVTREEYDVQAALLARAQERLQVLEARIAAVERSAASTGTPEISPHNPNL